MSSEMQESRSERVAVACTRTEKRAVRLLAEVLNSTESDVMRDMTMEEILLEYARIREQLGLSVDEVEGKAMAADEGGALSRQREAVPA